MNVKVLDRDLEFYCIFIENDDFMFKGIFTEFLYRGGNLQLLLSQKGSLSDALVSNTGWFSNYDYAKKGLDKLVPDTLKRNATLSIAKVRLSGDEYRITDVGEDIVDTSNNTLELYSTKGKILEYFPEGIPEDVIRKVEKGIKRFFPRLNSLEM